MSLTRWYLCPSALAHRTTVSTVENRTRRRSSRGAHVCRLAPPRCCRRHCVCLSARRTPTPRHAADLRSNRYDRAGSSSACSSLPGRAMPPGCGRLHTSVTRRLQDLAVLLLGPVSVHGLCPVDLPREPARHRGVPAALQRQALPHGHSRQVSRSTLADANETRLAHLRRLRPDPDPRRPDHSMWANPGLDLDTRSTPWTPPPSTCACRCFPGRSSAQAQGAVKMHTLLDLRGNIPAFIRITDGKLHDVNILDQLLPEAGAFYVMDRGYSTSSASTAALRQRRSSSRVPKRNFISSDVYSHPVDKTTGVQCDQTVISDVVLLGQGYPTHCAASATTTPRRTSGWCS